MRKTESLPIPYADPDTPPGTAHGPRVFGKGSYSNWDTARVVVEPGRVRIAPAPTPVVAITVTNLMIAAVFVGWLYVVYRYVQDSSQRTLGLVVGSVIGVVTHSLFTAVTVGMYRYSQRKGGWLEIDFGAGTVTLFRQNRVLPLVRLLRFEHLNMWQHEEESGRRTSRSNLGEVHAILAGEEGHEERVCLLQAMPGVYDKLCRQLAAHAGVPVLYVRERIRGNGYDVTPVAPARCRD